MLTRIEIDGFKSFRDFELDVPPFLVIIGRNDAGKSNLFDAIQFLSRLAGGPIVKAAQDLRGDVGDLFHRHSDGTQMDTMSFAVEVLLGAAVTDDFGERVEIRHPRVRYELVIERREVSEGSATSRPYVLRESARRIARSDDRWAERFAPSDRAEDAADSALLTTGPDERGQQMFNVLEQDGRGRGLGLPAGVATASALSALTIAADYPLLYALKKEMQSWRLLHLDPSALRTLDSYDDPDVLTPTGAHLPNALRRIVDVTGTLDRPAGMLNDLAADVAAVIPGVIGVDVLEDEARRQRQVQVTARAEPPFTARLASDGTLRAIALLAALYDPDPAGLICFEEPENGIFPGRLVQFARHLGTLVQRSLDGEDTAARRQLVLSSHSPAILRALASSSNGGTSGAVFLDTATRAARGQPDSRITRCRLIVVGPNHPVDIVWTPPGIEVRLVSPAEIAEFEVSEALDH